MEREIIFRGKRIDNGEWVEGDLLTRRNAVSNESAIIFFDDEHIIPRSPTVVFETVGQYTGLKDSTGKRIFEGDIAKTTLGWAYEVGFDAENGRFLGYFRKPFGETFICYVGREPKATIIGNIHDNPELLEVQE